MTTDFDRRLNISNRSILAIVPARAGSKGLTNKNILDCAGKPLIAWTIEAACESSYVDRVLVSTDSGSIADTARKYGAWVPFLRDLDLAKDDSSIVDVVNDTLSQLEILGEFYDYVVLLQPTSPLRNSEHINSAFEEYFLKAKTEDDTLVSVKEIEKKTHWIKGIDHESGYLYSLTGLDLENPRRQMLPNCYFPNGAIYIARSHNFTGYYGSKTIPFIMNEESSTDIDYIEDLKKAEKLLQYNIKNN